MKKKYFIRKNHQIQNIYKNGKKIKLPYVTVIFSKNEFNYNRYLIAISKKNANAVKRNKIRRQIKEILHNYLYLETSLDIIINIKYDMINFPFEKKSLIIKNLFEHLPNQHNE